MADRRSSREGASSIGHSSASETESNSHETILLDVKVEIEKVVEEVPRTSGEGKGLMVRGDRGSVLLGPYAPGAILSSNSDSETAWSGEATKSGEAAEEEEEVEVDWEEVVKNVAEEEGNVAQPSTKGRRKPNSEVREGHLEDVNFPTASVISPRIE